MPKIGLQPESHRIASALVLAPADPGLHSQIFQHQSIEEWECKKESTYVDCGLLKLERAHECRNIVSSLWTDKMIIIVSIELTIVTQ